MEGLFTFQWGEVVFQMGDSSLSGGRGAPWGPSVLMGGVFKKNCRMWGSGLHAPASVLNKNKSAID